MNVLALGQLSTAENNTIYLLVLNCESLRSKLQETKEKYFNGWLTLEEMLAACPSVGISIFKQTETQKWSDQSY